MLGIIINSPGRVFQNIGPYRMKLSIASLVLVCGMCILVLYMNTCVTYVLHKIFLFESYVD